ncbi:TonB-dependent receptor [Sphingobium sp. HBC34]|uniref:TonB-dependent receptor n=1 Tax=Sphingobium cyanobacteriorum TaxID=3063954 RepID=A0ABT8ZPJ6_9SPHN|nr:TonB-dependent receptor [Sphingobium sp. HBC34]MDO7836459.1 TonB-dependent receptor [Sphingobium sp. HBC34]
MSCVLNRSLTSVVAITMGLMSVGANAQGGGSVEPSSNAEVSATEIIVTAQKTSQSLQSVPMSISAISGDDLSTRAVQNVGDITRSVPGVNYQETNGATQITIRGVGLQVQTGLAEPNVALHIDGIFQPAATEADVPIVDLERVEVLRGPQGTLYGRNATGGTINFITKKPTSTFEAGGSLGTGSFDAVRANGYVSGPITGETLMGRVSAYYNRDDGYYYNSFLDKRQMGFEKWGVRGALRFLPSSDVTVDLSGYYQHGSGETPVQSILRGTNPLVDGLVAGGLLPAGSVAIDTGKWRTAGEISNTSKYWTAGTTLDAKVDISDALSVRSVTGFIKHEYGPFIYDADGTSLGIVTLGTPGGDGRFQTSKSISQEFNFSGELDKLRYVVGLFYFHETAFAVSPAYFPDPLIQAVFGAGFAPFTGSANTLYTGLRSSMNVKTDGYAGFADLTYSVTPSMRLNVGLRQTFDRKNYVQSDENYLVVNGAPLTLPNCSNLQTKLRFNHFDYKIRAEADIADRVLAYGQYQTGFKDGGVNLSACGDTFKPEKIGAFEAGLKTSTSDRTFTFNASAFHYKYDGLQVLSFITATLPLIENVDRATITGGELEAVMRPSRRLTANLALSLLYSKIKKFSSFDSRQPQLGVQDLKGKPLPSAPQYTVNAGIEYALPVANGAVRMRAETFFSSAYNLRMFDQKEDEQRAYTVTNLSIGYEFGGGDYQIRGFVKNLENTAYQLNGLFAGTVGTAGTLARPREWGVDATVRF